MIELTALERAIAAGESDRVRRLQDVLASLERGEPFDEATDEAYGRLARAIAELANQDSDDTDLQQALSIGAAAANSLFAISGVGIDNKGAPIGLDCPGLFDVEAIFALQPPSVALMRLLALIATSPVLTREGEARRELLIESADRLRDAELPASMAAVSVAASAWMNCSYALRTDRHRLKPVLNAIYARLLARLSLPTPLLRREIKAQPTMVVVAEVIHERHVQFRYFGQYLRQLRTRFRLVLVTPRTQLGPNVGAMFDEVFAFDPYGPSTFLADIAGAIGRAAPDIVFWPSVGMARWGPLLANMRLAPIQMTALGHSASTFIPAMDYYLTEEGYVSDPELFSEKLLLLPDTSLRFERPPAAAASPVEIREEADPVRIAVPSNVLKLNPTFLDVLLRIRRGAGRPVEFNLFPNGSALAAAALRAAHRELMETATIHPRLGAAAYQAALNRCDLVLSPFPFGGLHSVVDALRGGLPVVAMEGAEPHARTDAMILRRLGMPEWLIASNLDDYVAAALSVIDDDEARVALSRQALATDVDRVMFSGPGVPLGREVGDMVWACYLHHEALMADPKRAWRISDLLALGGDS